QKKFLKSDRRQQHIARELKLAEDSIPVIVGVDGDDFLFTIQQLDVDHVLGIRPVRFPFIRGTQRPDDAGVVILEEKVNSIPPSNPMTNHVSTIGRREYQSSSHALSVEKVVKVNPVGSAAVVVNWVVFAVEDTKRF